MVGSTFIEFKTSDSTVIITSTFTKVSKLKWTLVIIIFFTVLNRKALLTRMKSEPEEPLAFNRLD